MTDRTTTDGKPVPEVPAGPGETITCFEERESCIDGKKHDWSGWEDCYNEDGRVCGGTAVCVHCGMTALHHALMFEP